MATPQQWWWILRLPAIMLQSIYFQYYETFKNVCVTLSNHKIIPVKFIGAVKCGHSLMLKDVLYVLQFKFNLMSVSSLTRDPCIEVRFFITRVIQDAHNQKMNCKGKRIADLYKMSDSSCDLAQDNKINALIDDVCVSISSAVNKVNTCTWHHKLGHLLFQKLVFLKDQLHLSCDKNGNHNSVHCNVCPLVKQRRLSFVSNNHLSINAFDWTTCDTWGPYHVPFHFGYMYFLTLVDDCTCFTWSYLMKHKLESIYIIPTFFKMIEIQFQKIIKKFSQIMLLSRN